MDTQKSFKRAGTHHGRFHADEVMATAILKEIFDIELTRTRDPEVLGKLDIVYDVGGGEFDHHGIEKAFREDKVPYAASGLIWKRFGRDVIHFKDSSLNNDEIASVFEYVDRVLIEGIDALDNGFEIGERMIPLMDISSIIARYNPPWNVEKSEDEAFNEAVEFAAAVLKNTLEHRFSVMKSNEKVISAYKKRAVPEVMVLDCYCPWGENLRNIDEKEEVLFVVYPDKDNYALQTVRGRDRRDKKPLPREWAGKRDEDLAAASGVEDAVFCHTGRFIAVAKSFEGIMKMAGIAVNEPEETEKGGLFKFITRLFLRKQ